MRASKLNFEFHDGKTVVSLKIRPNRNGFKRHLTYTDMLYRAKI